MGQSRSDDFKPRPIRKRIANRNISRAFRWQHWSLLAGVAYLLLLVAEYHGLPRRPDFILDTSPITYIFAGAFRLVTAWLAISVGGVCYYAFKGSVSTRGLVYAWCHVVLIVLLTPVFFMGVFLIPHLMNADALRLRDWQKLHGQEANP